MFRYILITVHLHTQQWLVKGQQKAYKTLDDRKPVLENILKLLKKMTR